MATGSVRIEIHPPGTLPDHRGPAPLASVTLPITGTTPTDPNALATVASLFSGGFTGSCVAFITPNITLQNTDLWCSVGKSPDVTKEPRHLLAFDNTGRVRTFLVDIGISDRLQLAATI